MLNYSFYSDQYRYILGIESSCDETGVAIYDSKDHKIYHTVYSQLVHQPHGGVVPELASREHIRQISPLLNTVLRESDIPLQKINGIAYTAGPGLAGALLVGASFAKSLAWSLNIPVFGVNHMEGHLLAPFIDTALPPPDGPFVALLVSGGHTQLIYVEKIGKYQLIGDTLDDAAGEAFDKTGKLLGLGYPAGAALSALAKTGDSNRFAFSRPMTRKAGLDFSFSGLKTQVVNLYHALSLDTATQQPDSHTLADIAASFQQAVIDTLVIKCQRALKKTGLNRLLVSGGVSANYLLKTKLHTLLTQLKGQLYFPLAEFCTDNGAMIAFAGYFHLIAGKKENSSIAIKSRWEL